MPYKNPEKRREYDRQRRRAERVGPTRVQPVPPAFRLRTAQDAVARLEEQAALVTNDRTLGTVERARCVGYLVGVALRAIEAGDLTARLEALEEELAGQTAVRRNGSGVLS